MDPGVGRQVGRHRPRPAGDRLRVLQLPLGDRLEAVAVRPRRGRSHRAAARANHRDQAGLRRGSDPLPGVRASHRHQAPRGGDGEGRRPCRGGGGGRAGDRLVARDLRRRQLARARDPRDVRHRVQRASRPAQHVPAHRVRGLPAAQGLPAARPDRQTLARHRRRRADADRGGRRGAQSAAPRRLPRSWRRPRARRRRRPRPLPTQRR